MPSNFAGTHQVSLVDSNLNSIGISTNPLPVSSTPSFTTGLSVDCRTALSTTVVAVKTSAGAVYGYIAGNPNTSAVYLQYFNLATGSVTLGTTPPFISILIPGAANGAGANVQFAPGILFSTAISVAVTTTPTGAVAPSTACILDTLYA